MVTQNLGLEAQGTRRRNPGCEVLEEDVSAGQALPAESDPF